MLLLDKAINTRYIIVVYYQNYQGNIINSQQQEGGIRREGLKCNLSLSNIKKMGCSSAKQNVLIQVAYCGGCGWSIPAKRVCETIKSKMPRAIIDCRPEENFTGTLIVSLITETKQKIVVYTGGKDQVLASLDSIVQQLQQRYNDL